MLREISPEMDRINGVMIVCEQKLDSMFGKTGWPENLAYWARVVRFLRKPVSALRRNELCCLEPKRLNYRYLHYGHGSE